MSKPKNYRVRRVSFTVVREAGALEPRLLDTPDLVADLARQLIPDDAREHFWTFMLNAQNQLVATYHVSTGTLTSALVSPREVFGPALRLLGVASVVMVHNHPSGDVTPSAEDRRLTRQLADAAKLLDLNLLDHVIIGNGRESFYSFASRRDPLTWRACSRSAACSPRPPRSARWPTTTRHRAAARRATSSWTRASSAWPTSARTTRSSTARASSPRSA